MATTLSATKGRLIRCTVSGLTPNLAAIAFLLWSWGSKLLNDLVLGLGFLLGDHRQNPRNRSGLSSV
jgi:hypothetical protein